MIKAVIFDIDGTLLDTKEFIFQAFEHVFQMFKLTHLSRKDIDSIVGKPLEECYKIFAPHLDNQRLCDEHWAFQENNMALVEPFKNTVKTLRELKSQGIKIAVVSTRRRAVSQSLEQTGIIEYLDCIIGGDDVKQFKPHPEGIHKALQAFDIPPAQAMMVGDTVVDIQAGKNASTSTAAALYGFGSKESLEAAKPDYMLNDVLELLAVI